MRTRRRVRHLHEARRLLRALADAEHATEALRFELLDVEHLDRDAVPAQRACAAAATMSAGDFSFDGVFTMSRAHVTASPTVAPRLDRGAHRGAGFRRRSR